MSVDRGLLRECAPFAATALLGYALVPIGTNVDWLVYGCASALAISITCTSVLVPWRRVPRALSVFPPLLALVAVALLRQASGGAGTGVAALAALPVFWVALHGTRAQLLVVIGGLFPLFLGPVLLGGGHGYPAGSWRIAVLFAAASALIGLAVQNLVARVRSHADALAVREHDLETMADLTRSLHETTDARDRICAAACDVSGAHFAVLLEGRGALALTAGAGLDEAFDAADRPATVLVEPVQHGDRQLGLLVVGWHEPVADARRTTGLIRLLASEAALVIERADLLGRLTEQALTDALTGLPNRRAWDVRLEQALLAAEPVCVAILDLDAFKAFNDGRGHQAGDQMLKEAAAAWSAQLRPADTLARYGGDEFLVLLPGLDLDAAGRVVERLRVATPRSQSCSAGLACRETGDVAATLLSRADQALYDAKRRRAQNAPPSSQPTQATASPATIDVTR